MEKFLFGLVSWSWPRPVAGQVTAPDLQQSRVMEGRRCPHTHTHTHTQREEPPDFLLDVEARGLNHQTSTEVRV